MSGAPNPYRSPVSIDQSNSWWSKLRSLLLGDSPALQSSFADGGAILFEGVSFFIDPDDQQRFYAALPSSVTSQTRMNAIVAEAIRVLPIFLVEYPELQEIAGGRRLVVRMIARYVDTQAQFVRQEETNLVIAHAACSSGSATGAPEIS